MKNLLLFSALILVFYACTKKKADIIRPGISGNYNVKVHYHDQWYVDRTNHGIKDTIYNSVLTINNLSGDTIMAKYTQWDGQVKQWNLYLNQNAVPDSLVYALPYGYDYLNATIHFYPNNDSLILNTIEKSNPSGGGGHHITNEIRNL